MLFMYLIEDEVKDEKNKRLPLRITSTAQKGSKYLVALSQACFSLSVNRTFGEWLLFEARHINASLNFHQTSNSVQASEEGLTNEHVHTLSSRDILSSESRESEYTQTRIKLLRPVVLTACAHPKQRLTGHYWRILFHESPTCSEYVHRHPSRLCCKLPILLTKSHFLSSRET